jgi:vanillate O-demethylase ferredoxin subunit
MTGVMKLRVTSVTWETEAIRKIELRALHGAPLPPFEAGSHIDLHLPNHLVRSYSLMNPQGERHRYVLGVGRDKASRGGSEYLHDQLRVGQVLGASQPRNLFKLHETAPVAVLIGGGIGITPLVCMAARLAELGRDWKLYYAVRARDEAAFAQELRVLGNRVVLHCDDERGDVLDLAGLLSACPPEAHIYCCGPKLMMVSFGKLTSRLASERIHVEHFTPLDDPAVDGGFLVELAKSGGTIAVSQGSTILETLVKAGLDMPSSCQQGICGVCETRVLAGVPDHRDSILSPAERAANRTMMICCSGSRSEKLVLDI